MFGRFYCAFVDACAVADGHVDAAAIEAALVAIAARGMDSGGLPIEVIDAFSMPLLRFDTVRQAFVLDPAAPSKFAAAGAKPNMYRLRLALLTQRVKRHAMFKAPVRCTPRLS